MEMQNFQKVIAELGPGPRRPCWCACVCVSACQLLADWGSMYAAAQTHLLQDKW